MNRRNFISGLISSFVVLPSATTYARKWVKTNGVIRGDLTLAQVNECVRLLEIDGAPIYRINPAYVSAPYEVHFWSFGEPFKEIKIGPPPKINVSSEAEFRKLFWNGDS